MSDPKVTRLVSTEGKTRTLELEDGSVIERSNGSVSWRNNNPGNLKFEFAGSADPTVKTTRSREKALESAQKLYDGVVGLDQWGNAVFESYEAGRAAKISLLQRRHGEKTVEELLPSYSREDYSGKTNHRAQAEAIFKEGDRQGVDLRGKTVSQMSEKELAALADGIKKFEGWTAGETRQVSAATREIAQAPETNRTVPQRGLASAAILNEAEEHFFKSGNQFEYGRSDLPKPGRDPSRFEKDLDGDGKLGVDCSSFVWRSLKNAGYGVPGDSAAAFTTHTLFNGSKVTGFAEKNFDVISAADARKPNGNLQPGDILMFATKSGSQHVGIFKGYDEKGQIKFVGSQGSTGPAEVTIKPNGYWDGSGTTIVGALRAKPEFQMREPLHGRTEDSPVTRESPRDAPRETPTPAASRAMADGVLKVGDRGPEVIALQEQLNALGYRGRDGQPLETRSGIFGPETEHAVRQFQQAHGLEQDGKAGRVETLPALERARNIPLVSEATHPNHALYEEVGRRIGQQTGQPPKPEAVANVTLQMLENGFRTPDDIKGLAVSGTDVHVQGPVSGSRVSVDLEAPTADMQSMSDHMTRQTQEQRALESQQRQQQPSPVMAA